jgi:hypothetical protein
MIHGDHKAKEMARSILPSRWRGAGKVRAFIHRAARRQVSQSLHALNLDPALWDDGVELGEEAELDLPGFVNRRRGSDKLNHFERWAVERTRALPKVERLGHLRALLPAGLIGEHAMTHLRSRAELTVDAGLRRKHWSTSRKLLMDRGELAVLLRGLLEVRHGVRCLHLALKTAERTAQASRTRVQPGPRRLAGIHDVRPFLKWLGTDRTARFVVDVFLRHFKQTGDVELALKRTIAPAVIPHGDVEWTYLRR